MKTHRSSSSCAGFSLVEVTIAVAIAAMGFITLLGLLPQGLNMARNTAQMATGSRIIQKLNGEMQSASWADITWKGYGPLRYFTSEGAEITAAESGDPELLASHLAYVASVELPEQPLDVILPAGVGAAQPIAQHLRRVRINVASSSDPQFDFAKASPMRVTSATALVAQMGTN